MVLASSRQSVICLATTISIVIVLSCFGEIGRQPRQHEHVAAWTSGRWLGQEKPRGAQDDSADDDPSLTSQKETKNGNEVEKEKENKDDRSGKEVGTAGENHGGVVRKGTDEDADDKEETHDATDFAAVFGLSKLPPFWFQAASGVMKPVVTILLFGPPKPLPSDKVPTIFTKVKNAGKGLIQFGFFVIAFITMWSDFVNIRHVFQSELTVWEKVNGFMFACSLSPNMLSAASAFALYGLYQMTIEFVWTHSRARRQGAEEREVLIDDDEDD